jgi:hypothetical protein
MSDAEFRALFTRFDPSVEQEFVEQLLAEIDHVIGPPGQADAALAGGERAYLFEPPDHQMVAFARPRAQRRRAIAVLAAVAAVIVVTVAVAVTRPSAHHQPEPLAPTHLPRPASRPQLYWLDQAGIGRSNLDGTDIVHNFIPFDVVGGVFNVAGPCGMAVDRKYVYWIVRTSSQGSQVARAKRDRTGLDTTFITDLVGPQCLAVDSAHIYWTTDWQTIGRANLDGTGVNQGFIHNFPDEPSGLAVDGAHIYWANANAATIGRANIDGTGVNQAFIGLGSFGEGVVVDGAHIYWGSADGTIGRANLDGTGVNNSLISRPGVPFPLPCAQGGVYLYWVSGATTQQQGPGSNTIGRARLDGTDVQPDFLTSSGPLESAPGCAIGP